ncbi:hypothetical protein [Streptomyces sp. RPT161]|uniref:hypothetical protein n=1 Tax=Streptomyces sp. RPT161 TaxID=3015993 RepID=UPI0022B8FDF8|nr:hypothetical protein [Streptomyces sp. RPT161]
MHTQLIGKAAAAFLTGCALVAGAVGCTAATQSTGRGPEPAGVSTTMTDLATRSGRWPTGAAQLQAAFDQLDRECLSTAGFRLPSIPRVSLPVPENEAAAIDLDGRKQHGYGISTPGDSSAATANPNAYVSSLSSRDQKRFNDVQFGPGAPRTAVALYRTGRAAVPTAGCVARARRALAGDVQAWAAISYVPQQLDDQLSRKALQDASYQAALARWRVCMAKAGYPYASPEAAVTRLRREHEQGASGSGFRRLEIAVAVADGQCASHTHLPSILLRARRQLTAQLPAGNLSFLRSVTESWESAVARARSVLSDTALHDHAAGSASPSAR